MRAVNLLPRDDERKGSEGGRAPILVAGGGIVAVTAAAAVLFMSASGSVSDQRAQLESVEAAIARVPAPSQPAVAPGTFAQERTDRVTALTAALSTRVPVDRLLRELAYVLPEDAWLTGIDGDGADDRCADRCSSRSGGSGGDRGSRRHDPGCHVLAPVRRARARPARSASHRSPTSASRPAPASSRQSPRVPRRRRRRRRSEPRSRSPSSRSRSPRTSARGARHEGARRFTPAASR